MRFLKKLQQVPWIDNPGDDKGSTFQAARPEAEANSKGPMDQNLLRHVVVESRWWWWCCVDDWWCYNGDWHWLHQWWLTLNVQESSRTTWNPNLFVCWFRYFSGLEAPQGNVGLKRRILRWVEWADTPRLAVKQWDSNAVGVFHIFCCLGHEECKYFPFTIRIDDVRSDPLIPLHRGDGSGALGGCWLHGGVWGTYWWMVMMVINLWTE